VEGSSSRRVQSRQGILRRVKPKYHRRKVVWDCISALVRAGFTAQVAIDRVYQLYGKNTKFTRISNRMNETRSSSWHRASIVAGLKISIRLILILLFMDTSLHDNYNKLTREAAKGAQHHRDNYILLLFASLSSSLLVISAESNNYLYFLDGTDLVSWFSTRLMSFLLAVLDLGVEVCRRILRSPTPTT
jgi:hypothetical protein